MGAGEVVQGDPQGTAWPSRQTGMSLEFGSRSYGFAYLVEEFEFLSLGQWVFIEGF